MAPTAEKIIRKQEIPTQKKHLSENEALWSPEFQRMLDGIRDAFSRDDLTVDENEVEEALIAYKSDPSDWAKFAEFRNHKYTRHLLDEHEDKYNVMLLCWDVDTKSCIHDHSGSHCFMKVLDGQIVESRFAWPDENQDHNEIEFQHRNLINRKVLNLDEVLYIHDKVGLHRVDNPDKCRKSVSLHVYIPPFRECQTFDQRTGKARVSKLRFDTKLGVATTDDDEQSRKSANDKDSL